MVDAVSINYFVAELTEQVGVHAFPSNRLIVIVGSVN